MENTIICLDTSVLIDFCRKKDKSKSLFFKLTEKYISFSVSAVTEYELRHIMIAGTAMQNNMPLAILNRKYFERINGLTIITE